MFYAGMMGLASNAIASRWAIILLSLWATIKHTDALGSMNTVAALWGSADPAAGYYGVCALKQDTFQPACVGNHYNYTNAPQGTTALWAISGGMYFTCGLTYTFRNPVCWGLTSEQSTARVLTIPSMYKSRNYSSISSGGFHVCAIRNDALGSVDCWGDDVSDETKPPSGYSFAYVSSGWDVSYGVERNNNKLVTWGQNWKGYSRNWSAESGARYSAIFAGSYHVCGIELDTNKTLCSGLNDDHQCDVPTNYIFSSLAAGKNHTCGLRYDNHEAVCWGSDAQGQLQAPKGVPFSFISAADWYTCGVRRDNESQITCWGAYLGSITNFIASQGLCQTKCNDDEYYIPGKCPSSTDKICLQCSQCVAGTLQSSPCNATSDTTCISSPSPIPSPSLSPLSSLSPSPRRKLHIYIIIVAALGGILVLAFIASSAWCMVSRRKTPPKNRDKIQEFSSSTIQEATSNYEDSMVIGIGASCLVYKGKLKDGRLVAVKKPKDLKRSVTFDQELDLLKALNHACLVNLVGYCKQQKILVFEFMENGSLFDCLFAKKSVQLHWSTRIRIAAQISRGLEYLHTYACPTIIHRDVKSANVLLDKDWNAHVADFGISLVGPEAGDTHLSNTRAVGTPGYVDPEYATTLRLTTKSDIYSFGMVILELLTGKRALSGGDEPSLLAWITRIMEFGDIASILDPALALPADISPLVEVLELALQCVTPQPKERPSMVSISITLERCLQALDVNDNMTLDSTSVPQSLMLDPR